MTLRSSPTTSDSTRATVRAAHAAARRPPLIAERCLRTVFSAWMSAPDRSNTPVAARLSSSVSPSAGKASSDDAPPEISTSSNASGGTAPAIVSARRAAASLPAPGCGCSPTIVSNGSGICGRSGATTSPPAIRSPNATDAACAIAIDALPAAITETRGQSLPSCARWSRTSTPASTARIPARAMSKRSARSALRGEVSDCVWGLRRKKGR